MLPPLHPHPDRRRWLQAALASGAALAVAPAWPRSAAAPCWATAWNDAGGSRVGLLAATTRGPWQVVASVRVPTRAHGVTALPDGSLVAVARRPGDWLLRWHPGRTPRAPDAPVWADAGYQFNGHAALLPDGRHLLTTETDTALDQGVLTLRRLDTLAPVQRWPTGGRDPHQVLVADDGRSVWVANGGIASAPETGRARVPGAALDASIVRLDLSTGAPLGRWVLDDPWLSLRHLAWHAPSGRLGVALQAEHPDPAVRAAMPVLAILDPAQDRLEVAALATPMAGYGGDICATAQGFAVSSPRASQVGFWNTQGQPQGSVALEEACALSFSDAGLLVGTRLGQARLPLQDQPAPVVGTLPFSIDNHWVRGARPDPGPVRRPG
jgi:hypothetical protein